ncbi:cytochrome P450 [Pseudonocardiaceae bacterium YIM PH 21723]|nr:cytochrome P450 [Pseudonocardiaceae bacterium YIM PH 21723]
MDMTRIRSLPLPSLVQTLLLMWNRPWLRERLRRYGDIVRLKVNNGGGLSAKPFVMVNRPEHVQQIFSGSPSVLYAGVTNSLVKPILGEKSLLLLDDVDHARAKRLLLPAFTAAALRGYEPMVRGLAKEELERWRPHVVFRSFDRMQALTLEVILQVVFGVADPARLTRLRELVPRISEVGPLVFLSITLESLQKIPPWSRFLSMRDEVYGLLDAEIAERRACGDAAERRDVLSRLVLAQDGDDRLSDAELRSQLLTLLLAGHETTATAMAWTLHELARNELIQHQARTGTDEYRQAVLKEVMRLRPITTAVARHLTEPMELAGHRVPAGHGVAASMALAHSDPRNYPDPDRFRPDRFLSGEVMPNTWFPFGGGARRCIGAGFSLMEATAILGEILASYEIHPGTSSPERGKPRNVVTGPHRGALIMVQPV